MESREHQPLCSFQLWFLTDECTLTVDCFFSPTGKVYFNLPKITLNIGEGCRLIRSDGTAAGILDSDNAYINVLSYLAAPHSQKKTRTGVNVLVLGLLIEPILAVQVICHPSVCRTAAETTSTYRWNFQEKNEAQLLNCANQR